MSELRERLENRLDQVEHAILQASNDVEHQGRGRIFMPTDASNKTDEIERDRLGVRLRALEQERGQLRLTLLQMDSTKVTQEATVAEEALKASRDDVSYWHRRYYTSLVIGSGAGFLAIANALMSADQLGYVPRLWLTTALFLFGVGVILAGAVPFCVFRQRSSRDALRKDAWDAAANLTSRWSAACFVGGIATIVGVAITNLSDKPVAQAAPSTSQTADQRPVS